jgi:hypothetical protein
VDHLERRVGRCRDEAFVSEAEQPGVQRVDAVDVLQRIDRIDDDPEADTRRPGGPR